MATIWFIADGFDDELLLTMMAKDGTLMNMVIAHICGIICNELQRTNQKFRERE